ncbi:MAG TPA: P1 family peptidase [Chloroflexota bacterium]|nr:P1 family peptidase [Chloroflexota bacterium]
MRASELGIRIGRLDRGAHNAITDVEGVRVGQRTVWSGEHGGAEPVLRTGVTAVMPSASILHERLYAATSVFNGYGEMTGKIVIDEWGLLGTPILLTNTVSVGRVYDATVQWMFSRPQRGPNLMDIEIPVVAETWGGYLNDDTVGGVTDEDVFAALDGAIGGPVEEGSVGSGTGMSLFAYKGGIGTSSRVVEFGGARYTVGVLLQTNYGKAHRLTVAGVPVGELLDDREDRAPAPAKEGSCIAVVATDAPLHPLQLRRLARRVDAGLARTGSVASETSGEIFMAFSIANRIPAYRKDTSTQIEVLIEGSTGQGLDLLFEATADATEEAALNALFAGVTVTGVNGHIVRAAPVDRIVELLKERGVIQ